MKISIIGGGITGLTTAIALHKNGISCKVYESAESLTEVGAGIWIQPNAIKVLNYLGVGKQVKEAGFQLNEVKITDAQLIPLKKTDYGFNPDSKENVITSIHRARLQKILYDALPENTVQFGMEYIGHEKVNERISIDFKSTRVETDVLLGADGIHSKVRKGIFNSQLRYAGQTCWRGISKVILDDNLKANGVEMWGNNIRFGFASISPSEVYWFAVAKAPFNEKDEKLKRQAVLISRFDSFHQH